MALIIGEVAQQYDLSIPTLRYYEECMTATVY